MGALFFVFMSYIHFSLYDNNLSDNLNFLLYN